MCLPLFCCTCLFVGTYVRSIQTCTREHNHRATIRRGCGLTKFRSKLYHSKHGALNWVEPGSGKMRVPIVRVYIYIYTHTRPHRHVHAHAWAQSLSSLSADTSSMYLSYHQCQISTAVAQNVFKTCTSMKHDVLCSVISTKTCNLK